MGEETHRSGSSPNFPEVSLQHIGGADLLPQLPGKGVVMETVVQVFLHAFDRSFFLNLPLILPGLKTLYGFPTTAGIKDVLGFRYAGLQMHPSQLAGDIPQLMNDAPLDFEEGVNIFECLQESWITIGGDELQGFPL